MLKMIPPHIKEYLQKSPYGPFTDLEITRAMARIERGGFPKDEETVELTVLENRAAVEPTPRKVAIFINAIKRRNKARGDSGLVVPVCSCGSSHVHYDADGPNPMQQICDDCGAKVSSEHIRAVIRERVNELLRQNPELCGPISKPN
jgi:hypothetical protein